MSVCYPFTLELLNRSLRSLFCIHVVVGPEKGTLPFILKISTCFLNKSWNFVTGKKKTKKGDVVLWVVNLNINTLQISRARWVCQYYITYDTLIFLKIFFFHLNINTSPLSLDLLFQYLKTFINSNNLCTQVDILRYKNPKINGKLH